MEDHFITIDTMSQTEMLGSQTFNYFCLYAISKKTGHKVAISSVPYIHQGVVYECFDTPFSLFPSNTPYIVYNSNLCHTTIVEEELFKLDSNYNYVLNARFDYSSVYWKDILPELRDIFKIKQKHINDAKAIIDNNTKPLVCLNFRRGVYPIYFDNYMNYYRKALELVPSNATIIVLSDDFDWINTSLELKDLLMGRDVIRANYSSYVQISLLTLCDYIICCPSSFCFLGAILAQKSHAVKIFPYLHGTELLNYFKGFQFAIDTALPDWIQVKFT